MANVTRYFPADETFDDLFRGFLMRPVKMEGHQEMQIKMDVHEDERAYTVHAEIPGVKKEDIAVTIDGNQVTLGAEVKDEKEVKEGHKLLRSERYYGKVTRSFALAQDVDEASSVAKYNNGVLELVLPKKATASARKLTIQ